MQRNTQLTNRSGNVRISHGYWYIASSTFDISTFSQRDRKGSTDQATVHVFSYRRQDEHREELAHESVHCANPEGTDID